MPGNLLSSLLALDGGILLWIQECLRTEWLTPVMVFITSLGNVGRIWIVLGLLFLCFRKTRKMGVTVLLALVFSLLLNNWFLKNLIARTRPYEMIDGLVLLTARATDFSFPSGHAGSSFAAAAAIFGCMRNDPKGRRLRWVAVAFAVLIAFSRLYIGIHYPSDVLAGTVTGILCGTAAVWIVERVSLHVRQRF